MNALSDFSDYDDPDLGTVFILAPHVDLSMVTKALCDLGFHSHPDGDTPHAAAFSFNGARPHVIYSHNPVVDLRVLEVGTVPPPLRRAIQTALPTLSRSRIRADLNGQDERAVLRAIWAATETERMDMIEPLRRLAEFGRGIVAEEAKRGFERLQSMNQARIDVIAGVRLVAVAAVDLAGELMKPEVAQALLARPEDAADIFTADVADAIAADLEKTPIDLGRGIRAAPQDETDVTAAPAGLLRFDNMLSRPFPRGYRSCAGWLLPDRIWLTWATHDPRHGRVRYDGLIFTGARWLFCPRPYRLIERVRSGGA